VRIQFADNVAHEFKIRKAVLASGLGMYVERLLKTGEAYDRAELRWYLR